LLAVMLAAGALGLAAQVKTLAVTVDADTMTWNWGTNLTEFVGNCEVVITSPEQATLKAPKISLKLTKSGGDRDIIDTLKTVGATHFTLVTQPDDSGVRRRMTGTASQGATYSEQTNKVVLTGGAKIDSVGLPEGPDSERVSFSAQALTVDLGQRTVTASKGQMKVNTSVTPQ
jgi:lipopolysaccharide export system protein LptA